MTLTHVPEGAGRMLDAGSRMARDLTPGQRWTTGLMVALGLVVLGFGLPGATRTVFPAAASEAELVEANPSDGPVLVAPPSFTDTLVRPASPSSSSSSPEVAPATTAPDADADVVSAPGGSALASVVALYDPAVGFADRTDEAMAKRFLAAAGLSVSFVPIGDAVSTCSAAKDATLVVAGGPLPEKVRACLQLAGTLSLSFDDDAALGAVETAVSTRRGVVRSLFDTAAVAGGELSGRLGLVADERLRARVEPLLPAVRSAGLNITTVSWLPAGDPPAAVAVGLAGADLSGVLFATSTQSQSIIGSQLRVLSPSSKLVVLDAADSVTSSSYPAVFDGAIAVTSVQLPWHPGAVEQRATCRSTWESAQAPPMSLSDAELLRALTWCQHAALASALTQRASLSGLRDSLLGLEVASPITSQLGALRDGGYGPTTVTQVTWGAACRCWSSTTPFQPSGSAHG